MELALASKDKAVNPQNRCLIGAMSAIRILNPAPKVCYLPKCPFDRRLLDPQCHFLRML